MTPEGIRVMRDWLNDLAEKTGNEMEEMIARYESSSTPMLDRKYYFRRTAFRLLTSACQKQKEEDARVCERNAESIITYDCTEGVVEYRESVATRSAHEKDAADIRSNPQSEVKP